MNASARPSSELNIVAIESSAAIGSVAVQVGQQPIVERTLSAPRAHTRELHSALAQCLSDCGLESSAIDLVCYSSGPGSFTGLRLGATIARTLRWSCPCDVVCVPTFEALALRVFESTDHETVHVVRDARRGSVFHGSWQGSPDSGRDAVDLKSWDAVVPTLQPGDAVVADLTTETLAPLEQAGVSIMPPEYGEARARDVLKRGMALYETQGATAPELILPAYHRRPECEEVYEARARRRPRATGRVTCQRKSCMRTGRLSMARCSATCRSSLKVVRFAKSGRAISSRLACCPIACCYRGL